MIAITIFESPFDAQLQTVVAANAGDTVAEFLAASGVAERMQREPIVVRQADNDLLQAEYSTVLVSDEISLHVLPQGGSELLWYGLSTLIISAVVNYYMQDQLDSNSNPERSPTYDINAKGNSARLGAPKPVFYGRMRTYPDLGALPYTEFDANGDQVLYQLFEVRQGECVIDVADMRFEDTPLSSFEGYEVEVIAPGERSTIYPGQVVVSSELSSIEIGPTPNDFGSYKDMHHNVDSAPDASYYACDIGQTITRIALDIVAPNGIWRSNDEGKIRFRQVGVRLEARKVGDDDQPIGSWFALGNIVLASDAKNYRNAVRKTFSYAVEAARYEVRTVRTTTKTDTHYVSDTLNWVGLRGYTGDGLPLVTTTRIALKIRASEQLSDRGAGKFNVISTGKIPVWSPLTGWSAPQVTASPAWAFADILRNLTYGSARGDAYIDLQGLYGLAQQYAADGIEFHGGFDTETTVWDALKKVAAVGQAVPVDRAGVYYMVRDLESSVPAFMFTHSNIVKDSFRIDYSSVVEETVDAYRVSFLDKTQAYREASFICALPGSAKEKIKDLKLFGCVDHDQAFNWGMYLLASGFYRRQRVEFQTGIEGYLPFYGDTIAVSHYLIGREGQQQVSGDVVAFDGVDVLTLGEDFPALTSPHIILRGLDGSLSDAYAVTILNDSQVQITEAFDDSVLVFESGYERPHFMLGEGSEFFARVKIDSIKSAGNNVYTLSGFVDSPEVYDAAAGLPLPPVTELPPVLNLAPVITNLRAVLSGDVDTPQVLLRWDSKNADYFIVQTSADNGETWAPIATRLVDSFLTHAALVGAIKYRVSGVNFLQGLWVEVDVNTGEPSFVAPAPVTGLALTEAFTGTQLKFQWASDYTRHKVAFYLGAEEKLTIDLVGDVFNYSLSAATARANGLGRSFTVRVWSVSQYGKLSATSADLAVSNPLPGALDNLAITLSLGTVFVTYDLPTYADFDGVSIWASTENNFTPSNETRLANRLRERSFSFEMPDTLLYVRVAALDVWGDDYFVSGQYTLDPVDLFERLTGEILESHLHQSLLEPIQLINAPGGLVEQSIANANAIADEILNRAEAVAGEASARADALLAEAAARGAAITSVQNAQQAVNDSVASSINTLTAATNNNAAAIENAELTSANQFNSLSQQMSTLTAGTNSQFDYVSIWYFDTGVEGWIGSGASPVATNPGWMRPSDSATDPRVTSPTGLVIDGTKYTQVRLRIKKVGSPTWSGEFRWITSDDTTFATDKRVFADEPAYDADGVANLTFNIDNAKWQGKTVTRIRLQLPTAISASNYYEIDWVAVGRSSPGASSAQLLQISQAMTTADNALAQDITAANAAIAGKASTSALNAIDSRVTTAENTIASQSSILNNVSASLLNAESIPSGFVNGLNEWTFVRHGAPASILTAAGGVTIVDDPDFGKAAEISSFTAAGQNLMTKGIVQVIPGRIYEVKSRFKVTSFDGATSFNHILGLMGSDYGTSLSPNFSSASSIIVAVADSVIELVTRFSTVAGAGITAFNANAKYFRYGLRLNSTETGLIFRIGSISCKDVTETVDLYGQSAANSSALSLLDARVESAEDSITAQSTQATKLTSSLFPSSIFKNPTFLDWPEAAARPTGWSAYGSVTPTRHTGAYTYAGGNAVQFVTGTNGAGMVYVLAASESADVNYVDIEIVFTVTAGASLSGAGILFRWVATDATLVEYPVRLNDIYPAGTFALNKKYTVKTRGKKPAVVGKTFSHNTVHIMSNYSGAGMGALTSKTIIFDSLLITKSDVSADAIELLETRTTVTEQDISSISAKTTQLEASSDALELIQWTRNYSVSSTITTPLLTSKGAALPINNGAAGSKSSYIATGVTTNSSTTNQTIAKFTHNGTAWAVTQLTNLGQTGVHPIFLISGGVPAVRVANTSAVNVRVLLENEVFGGAGTANSKATESLSAIVTNSSTGVAATSDKVIALQNALGGADAGAFSTLKSQVEDGTNGLAAVGSKVDQVQASLPGSGNLIPTDSDFISDASGWANTFSNATPSPFVDWSGPESSDFPIGIGRLRIGINGNATSAIGTVITAGLQNIPVEEGKRYCFSAYIATARMTARVHILWRSATNAGLGEPTSASVTGNNTESLSGWTLASVFATAPAGAVKAEIRVRGTLTALNDPRVFFCRPMFSQVEPGVTVAPKYAPSGATATTAAVKVTAEAAASTANGAVARWEAKATIGALTGGVGFWIDTSVNPPVVRFGIHADQFYIFSPGKNAFSLVIDGDDIVMPGAKLQVESINTDRLVVNAVTSTSYVDGWSATGSHPGGPTITASISRGGVTQAKVMSVTKTKAGSSILATASVEYWFSTNSSLVAGNYVVEFYLNTITFRNSANGFAGNSVGGRGQDKRVMYLRPSEAYNVKMSYSAVLSNSSHTGIVYLSLENPYVQIKTSADADLSSRMANVDLIVYSSMTEIKV